MKNGNYMLRGEPNRAAGDKVINLEAWRAEHLMEPDGPEPGGLTARRGDRKPIQRRWSAADWAELAATLAVAAAFIALAARVLLF